MLQESQPINLLARSNELSFPNKNINPQRLEINRKVVDRQQSITRGTASSMAKAVRLGSPSVEPTAVRKKSLIKIRSQSLAVPAADKATIHRKNSLTLINHETMKNSLYPADSNQLIANSSDFTDLSKPQPFQRRLSKKLSAISLTKEQPVIQVEECSIYPLDAPRAKSPETLADVVASSAKQLPVPSRSSSEHTHHHCHNSDEDIPGYMRRPICAACNRNVKVTSSSETNNMRKSSSEITTSSTKSGKNSKQRIMHRLPNEDTNIKLNKDLTSNFSRLSSKSSHSTFSTNSSMSYSNTNSHYNFSEDCASMRSKSPSSPVPTRRRKTNYRRTHLASKTPNRATSFKLSVEKWTKLLSQQQNILLALSDEDSMALNGFKQMAINLDETNHEQCEAVLLEIQTHVLQKFALSLAQQQQQIIQYQKQQRFQCQLQAQQAQTKTQEHMQSKDELTRTIKSLDWHTELEYDLILMRWNMSQWTGSTIGNGKIEEQDFDLLGYPKSVVVSGVCVTIEPELLSKDVRSCLKPTDGQKKVICNKYRIRLSKDDRLFKFQLMSKENWAKDKDVDQCEFSVRIDHKTTMCSKDFGFFERRHHCRSCGHIFCQAHSSNSLPLFVDNGQRGEWARVCDICFYRKIDSDSISRS